MALLFASAASLAPRLIEFCGETNGIVTTYIEKCNSPDEQTHRNAWIEAINSIKRHGPWHSGLVAIKIFGDGIILFTMSRKIYEWLYKVFLFLRQIYYQPKEELIAKASIIKERVIGIQKNMTEINKTIAATENVAGKAVATGGSVIISDCANFRLSPTNLLKHLWKILNSSYSHVVQWLFCLRGQLSFEMTKYAIQICGCIAYYLEQLDKVWHFGLQ
jgi:hypothetical protein